MWGGIIKLLAVSLSLALLYLTKEMKIYWQFPWSATGGCTKINRPCIVNLLEDRQPILVHFFYRIMANITVDEYTCKKEFIAVYKFVFVSCV
jgi:hypothetical protein